MRTEIVPEEFRDLGIPYEVIGAIREDTRDILASYPLCPEVASELTPATPPRLIAASYWEVVDLPVPDPYIAPGKAITGLAAFMETRGQLDFTYFTDTVAGPLEIVATGRYYVDWGDGSVTGPYGHEGRPWPDGDITHSYSHVGTYDVELEIRWQATWSLGGLSGTLYELRTSATIEEFPVGQIQAVVIG